MEPSRTEKTICLCMIVKDESAIIERCLSSVKGLVDFWSICDTGSSDDTIDRVQKVMDGVPGELHRRPWVNFGVNRTEALVLARGKADYLLLIDADMTVTYDGEVKRRLSADSYLIRYTGGLDYRQRLLVSGHRTYRYVGAVHEYIETSEGEREETLEGLAVTHHADGASRARKLENDLELLKDALAREPDDSRAVFYLAQTYRDLGRLEDALEHYEMRASMGGWDEEVFYALYQVAVVAERYRSDWGVLFQALVRAWEHRPSRMEPLYHIVSHLRRRREHHTALLFARAALTRPYPSRDILFVHRWMYTYGMMFEVALCSMEVGAYEDAISASDKVLMCPDTPAHVSTEATRIRAEAVERSRRSRAPDDLSEDREDGQPGAIGADVRHEQQSR